VAGARATFTALALRIAKRLQKKRERRRVEKPAGRCNVAALNFPGAFMSQHRSLKGASTITAKRNVLKRFERVELLKKRGQFKDGQKVLGLPKTKPDV
jgi:small basic protein (TIGR04137 family)